MIKSSVFRHIYYPITRKDRKLLLKPIASFLIEGQKFGLTKKLIRDEFGSEVSKNFSNWVKSLSLSHLRYTFFYLRKGRPNKEDRVLFTLISDPLREVPPSPSEIAKAFTPLILKTSYAFKNIHSTTLSFEDIVQELYCKLMHTYRLYAFSYGRYITRRAFISLMERSVKSRSIDLYRVNHNRRERPFSEIFLEEDGQKRLLGRLLS